MMAPVKMDCVGCGCKYGRYMEVVCRVCEQALCYRCVKWTGICWTCTRTKAAQRRARKAS